MSVSASIDLRIIDSSSKVTASPIKILKILIDSEWKLLRNGGAFYLPLGNHDDDFDWESETITIESLMKILEEKELKDERIGVTVTWQDTDIGGEILLWTKKDILKNSCHINISFSLTSDRKILADYGHFKITDVNWYLERLLPIFNQNGMRVEYFTYQEHI